MSVIAKLIGRTEAAGFILAILPRKLFVLRAGSGAVAVFLNTPIRAHLFDAGGPVVTMVFATE